MADRVAVSWNGQEYEAVRKEGAEAVQTPEPVWQVTREGAPITSFAAQPREGPDQVREKIVEWLKANESRPPLDVGRQ
ncbi:hypothetical protein BH24GEM1_BH24GEM1_03140 [soil metagenome]